MAPQTGTFVLWELASENWGTIDSEAIDRLEKSLRDLPIADQEPNQYGTAGIRRIENVIGGFLIVQYPREVPDFDDQKRQTIMSRPEWEKAAFAVFPLLKVVLFQVRRYDRPLTQGRVDMLFQRILRDVFQLSKIGFIFVNPLRQTVVSSEEFLQVFENPNNRIEKLVVDNLSPNPLLEGLTYYNPRIDLNRVVSGTHNHDFDPLESLTMKAKADASLRNVHIAQAAIRSGTNEEMQYVNGDDVRHTLRRRIKDKYDISLDLEADPIRDEDLERMIDQVYEQYGISPLQRTQQSTGTSVTEQEAQVPVQGLLFESQEEPHER